MSVGSMDRPTGAVVSTPREPLGDFARRHLRGNVRANRSKHGPQWAHAARPRSELDADRDVAEDLVVDHRVADEADAPPGHDGADERDPCTSPLRRSRKEWTSPLRSPPLAGLPFN